VIFLLSHCYGFLLPVDTRGGGAIAAGPGVEAEVDQDRHEGEGGLLIVSPNTTYIEVGGLLIELIPVFCINKVEGGLLIELGNLFVS